METIIYEDFAKVEVRVGRVIRVEDFPDARKPAYRLRIDFGREIGVKNSSAQITRHYKKEELLDRLVLAVVNFPAKQIAHFRSEVLILGVPDKDGEIVLLAPDNEVELGARMF